MIVIRIYPRLLAVASLIICLGLFGTVPVWGQQSSGATKKEKAAEEKASGKKSEKKVDPDKPEIIKTEDGSTELYFPAETQSDSVNVLTGLPEIGETKEEGSEGVVPSEALVEQMPSDEGPPMDSELLLPEDIPSSAEVVPEANQPSSIEVARKNRNRYVEVRSRVERDPQVVEMVQKAEQARTTEDYRAARREYYRVLFEKMRRIDPSLKPRCDLMEDAYLRRLEQSRVEPTVPLKPPPTPAPIE